MKDDLFVNEIIEWISPTGEKLWERIIWIDENYTIAFVFDIHATKGFPKSRTISEIQEAITQGVASKVSSDPYCRIIQVAAVSLFFKDAYCAKTNLGSICPRSKKAFELRKGLTLLRSTHQLGNAHQRLFLYN